MALLSWLLHFAVKQAQILHSQMPNSLFPRVFIPSYCLGIEWRKDSRSLCYSPSEPCLDCWIFILHTYYSWSFTSKRLEVAIEPPLGVMSLEKFVLSIFVIVISSMVFWWLLKRENCWERPGSLWTPQRGRKILCGSEPRDKIVCLSCAPAFTYSYTVHLPSYWTYLV
jgi:hypothetical protein